MIEINRYQDTDKEELIELVLHCQNDGSRPSVSVDDQPELLCIEEKYFASGGYFWVAKEDGRVIESIGLMDGQNRIGILKKFFVYGQYRGSPCHLGQKLYAELLSYAKRHHMKELLLDTPQNTDRAHRFYEKAGFQKIPQEKLPVQFDHPYPDCDFFRLQLLPL